MSLFKGPSTTTRSNRIEAFQSTTCEFSPVNMLYGTSKISPNVICYLDFKSKEKKTTVKSGKSKSTTITYLYYVYVEMALGTPISGLGSIWVGDKKYSDIASLNGSKNEGASLSLNMGNNANPTAYMQTNHPDIAVGYSDLSYLYGTIFLGEDNASLPSYAVETKTDFEGDGKDANVAYVIRDILTKIGLGDAIDETSFSNYARYCQESDWLISTPADAFTSQKKASDVVAELLELTNTYMVFSVNKFKFIPRDDQKRGDWNPNTTIMYDLTADDMIRQSDGGTIAFKRKNTAEQYNYITVNFTNRANDYESESVSYQNVESVNLYGLRNVSYDAKWYHTKTRALKYAKMKARLAETEQTQYQFQLCSNYSRLESGDLLRITDETIGLNRQVVMISEVTESKDGILTVTAIQRANGNYSEAQYTVDNDYQYQDFNIEPSNTANPLFIIPPSDLMTSDGLEIWVALHGSDATWGGCDVYASTKDGDYSYAGTQGTSSMYGTITSSLAVGGTSVTIKLSNPTAQELLTGSVEDAQAGNTLIWVNGECMCYSQAEFLGNNAWRLTGLLRGQYGTTITAHASGEAMAVLDGNIYVVPLGKQHKGETIYFKFPSFNVFKANNQSVNDLDYYTCIANQADLPNCSNVTAFNKYREAGVMVVSHDIIVEWTVPDFKNYLQAQVWYKSSEDAEWKYAGQGYSSATIPQATIGESYTIAVCTVDIYGNVETPDMSAKTSLAVEMKNEIPNTPANLSVELGESFTIKWDEVENADIRYYEVRLDAHVGVDSANLLLKTSESKVSTNLIKTRQGTIYVFAVSVYGKVSLPATLTYNFATPSAPTITVNAKLQGLECISSDIPNTCKGVHWYFDGTARDEDIKTSNRTYFYTAGAGIYDVSACFYDYFGDGTKCATQSVTIQAYIPPELIQSESITLDKLSEDTQKAIEEGGLETVNVAVKGILGQGSALTLQPDGKLALVASNGQTLTGMFVNKDGVITLDGKYLHITGDTKIDGSVITNNMLAGGISADKMNVTSLSSISATIGTLRTATSGARMELASNQLRVYDSNGVLRVRLGVW